MLGSFICPYCKTENACNCITCAPHIKEGEFINAWTEDGNFLICGKCGEIYSPGQALNEERLLREKREQLLSEMTENDQKLGLYNSEPKTESHSDQLIDIMNDDNQWDLILEDHQKEEFPPFGGPFTNSLSLGEWLKKNFHPPLKK